MRAALTLWWHLRRRETSHDARLTRLAVAAFAVATTALLVTLGGVHAFVRRAEGAAPDSITAAYVPLSLTAAVLLVVPVLTLGGVAARLALSRRDARLASLRLTGATSGQVAVMTLAEAAAQAAVGAALGVVGYGLLLVPLTGLRFMGRNLAVGELWLGVPALLGVVVGVCLLAVFSGTLSLGRVVVGPLGVAARTTPARLSALRLVAAVAVLALWVWGFKILGRQGLGALLAVLGAVVATVNLAGPYLVMVAGRIVARFARRPATLLAARRIVDDPRATWRMVSSLALGILVAALSTVGGSMSGETQTDEAERLFAVDLGTGALVALAIIAVVAATSTGVVQAARVLDRRPAYRALALAGAPVSFLHRARSREVTIPLVVTLVLGGTFPLLILLPLSGVIGVDMLLRAALAVAAACALISGSVAASRSLVRDAARV